MLEEQQLEMQLLVVIEQGLPIQEVEVLQDQELLLIVEVMDLPEETEIVIEMV